MFEPCCQHRPSHGGVELGSRACPVPVRSILLPEGARWMIAKAYSVCWGPIL